MESAKVRKWHDSDQLECSRSGCAVRTCVNGGTVLAFSGFSNPTIEARPTQAAAVRACPRYFGTVESAFVVVAPAVQRLSDGHQDLGRLLVAQRRRDHRRTSTEFCSSHSCTPAPKVTLFVTVMARFTQSLSQKFPRSTSLRKSSTTVCSDLPKKSHFPRRCSNLTQGLKPSGAVTNRHRFLIYFSFSVA